MSFSKPMLLPLKGSVGPVDDSLSAPGEITTLPSQASAKANSLTPEAMLGKMVCLVCGLLIKSGSNPCKGHAGWEKAMSPEQLEQWNKVNRRSPQMNSDWRFCISCDKRYKTLTIHCPRCLGDNTYSTDGPAAPVQQTLFTVPPPPRPNAWAIEWKFKKDVRLTLASIGIPAGAYSWNRDPAFGRSMTTERQAVNYVRRMRKSYPGKSWRVRAVYAGDYHPSQEPKMNP